jgi:hypothetical protein
VIRVEECAVDGARAEEIAAFVGDHPAATAYALPAWLAAMRRYMGMDARYLVARANDRIVGVLPLSERALHRGADLLPSSLRPIRRESLGFDCYAGPLVATNLRAEDADAALDVLVGRFAAPPALLATLFMPAWSEDGALRRRLESVHGFIARHGYSVAVKPLAGLTPATLAATYHSKHRNAVVSATKRGVVVERASGVGDLLEFWDMLDETMAHANSAPKFPKDLVVDAGRDLIAKRAGDLWLARLDGVAVAGVFALHASKSSCWWLGATAKDEKAQHCRPMNLAIHTAFVDAVERGVKHFELGGLITEGLRPFKLRWGARELEQVTFERSYLGLTDRLREARALAGKALERARRLRA